MEQAKLRPSEAAPDDTLLEKFWIWWLRVFFGVELIVAAIVAVTDAPSWRAILNDIRERRGLYLIDFGLLSGVAEKIAFPVAFVACAFGCLAMNPRARLAMLIYCWCRMLWIMGTYAYAGWQWATTDFVQLEFWMILIRYNIFEIALLLITVIVLPQKPVKRIFARGAEARVDS